MQPNNKSRSTVLTEQLESRALFSATVANPFIDLSATVAISSPKNLQVLPGKTVGFAVTVTNNGTMPAVGPLVTDIDLTNELVTTGTYHPDIVSTLIPLGAPSTHIHIAAGKHQIIHLNEKIPVGFTPAGYFADITIDPGNTFNETDTTNNNATSSNQLTVLDPFPNILGSFSGKDVIKRGPDRGLKPTITLDFLTESPTTGAITANGSLFNGITSSPFSFTGTVTTKGVFTGIGSATGSPFIATYKGKLNRNRLTGTVSNTDGNVGAFTFKRLV